MNNNILKIKTALSPKKKTCLPIPTTDIHTHILPGVDDGFARMEESVIALERLQDLGVKKILLTPHVHPSAFSYNTESLLRERYAEFCRQIPPHITIKTDLAAEYMIENGFEERAEDRNLLTFSNGSILVEMSYLYKSRNLEQTIFALALAGKKPILAHPERYPYLSEKLNTFDSLLDQGCRLQLNLLSLTGAYGPESMKILRYLLDRNMYSFVASDLHSLPQLDFILNARIDSSLAAKASALPFSF